MKIKELQKTVNVAWSPEQLSDVYLAAGTAAQQLDSSPNTVSTLEIYSINLLDPSYDLELKGSQQSKYRFQKIIWSPTGITNGTYSNGLIVGGCEDGHIQIYNSSKLLNGSDDNNDNALLAYQNKHTGVVRGLDFNPFQTNLLASVASESEIFIWDLNNITTPMSPGKKTQPLEDIQNVSWNRQVQHILATVFSSKCVIWDLRKNEQIIKLSDQQSRIRWRSIQWHPNIATQLWLASEDDQSPYAQLWDLRYATSPAKTMKIHERGILGLTWCPKDSDLMVSCGKDNKIYCWNPNTDNPEGEILSEIATTYQWYSDVQWCPRNPAIIASSSFDGNVSIYSLYGGTQKQIQTSNKIADSFPGMDQFTQAPLQSESSSSQQHHQIYTDLKKAPKWMKRPVGISFGFGGRLVMFNNKNSSKVVNICQVITEQNLIERSNELEKAINNGDYIDYCKYKADQVSNDQHSRYLWYFIKANFEANPRDEILNLLGYNRDDIINKFEKYIKNENETISNQQVDQLTKQMSVLSHSDSSEVECDQSTDDSTDLSGGDNNALFDSISAAGNKTVENEINEECKNDTPFKIPTGESNESLICQAILTGNIDAAAEICMEFDRPAEALIIASKSLNQQLLHKIQKRYLNKTKNNELSNIINALITNDWLDITQRCTIDSWKEALVAALTHNEEQIGYLCDKLGERLQNELTRDPSLAKNSLLCYICAGNLEKLVNSWLLIKKSNNNNNNNGGYDNDSSKLSTDELQDLIEIVMLLKKSLEIRGQILQPTGKLAEFMTQYASLLAAQGSLNSALSYLTPSEDPHLEELRERLYYALGHKQLPQQQKVFSSRGSISQGSQHYQQQQQQLSNTYGQQTAANRYGQQRTNSVSSSTASSIQPPLPVISGVYGAQQINFNTTPLPGVAQQWNTNPLQLQSSSSQPWNTTSLQQQQQQSSIYDSTLLPPPPPVQQPQIQPPPPPPPSKPPTGSSVTTNDGLSQPQRPSSVGSQGATPLSRAKYVLDPSVTSGPNYGQTMGVYNPVPQSFNNSSYGQFNNNNNNNPGATVPSSLYQPTQQQQPSNPPMFSNPIQNNFQPFTPAPLASTTNLMTTNSSGYLSGIPPIETAQQALPPPPPSSLSSTGIGGGIQRNPTPPPGWNDPPVLKTRQQGNNYIQKNEMSAEHAGTRKWRKIINHNNNNDTNPINNYYINEYSESLLLQPQLLSPSSSLQKSKSYSNVINDNNSNFSTFMFQQQQNQQQQQPKVEPKPQLNPITHPIFGVDPNQGQNGYATSDPSNFGYSNAPPMFQQNQGMPPPPPPSSSVSSQNIIPSSTSTTSSMAPPLPPTSSSFPTSMTFNNPQENSASSYNPMNFKTQAIQPQQQQPPPPSMSSIGGGGSGQSNEQQIINEKSPLPEEFIYMQTVFEELKNQCQNIATDPRNKRKFADVSKRLEALYDCIRANKLSRNTLTALNQIVQLLQIGDYQNAMNVYTSIVSGPDFSQTASFMPGIKVLIQTAIEFKVYLR